MHADGYAGLNDLYRSGAIREVACMAHVRRKFVDIHRSQDSPIAEEAIGRIAQLYAVEKEARGSPPDRRADLRRAHAAPVFDDLEVWLATQLTAISGKSPLATAIRYALTRMERLRPHLDNGILELDNNVAERGMRTIASGESLCPSSSSIWKHWKLVSANGVTRAPFLLEGLDEVIILKILGPDLPRRARNDLLGRQNPALDHSSHDMAGHPEFCRGLAHCEPCSVLLGRAEGVAAGASRRVEHPRGHDHEDARQHLDMDKLTGLASVETLDPKLSAEKRVPPVMHLNKLPDIGRMNG